MAARILSVLAAVLLVGAVALAMLTPKGMTLAQALSALDANLVGAMRSALSRPAWLWPRLATPLLVRPAWLLPLEIGIVCAGAALSLNWLQVPSQRRRRS